MFAPRTLSVNSDLNSLVKYKTPEGYLVNEDVPISRGGIIYYPALELGDMSLPPDQEIPVYRPLSTFTPELLKQMSMIPVTDQHPDEPVNSETITDEFVGKISDNIYLKGNDCIASYVIVQAKKSIDNIENGLKQELSIGFNANYKYEPGVHDGVSYDYVENIERVNHIAIVYKGKSGSKYRLNEKIITTTEDKNSMAKNESTLIEKSVSGVEAETLKNLDGDKDNMTKNEDSAILELLNKIYSKLCETSISVNEDKKDEDKDKEEKDVKNEEDDDKDKKEKENGCDEEKEMKNSYKVNSTRDAFNAVDKEKLHSDLENENCVQVNNSNSQFKSIASASANIANFINK